MKKLILPTVAAALVASCASTPPEPASIGNGRYILADSNASIFGSQGELIVYLTNQANTFCQKQGKSATVVDSDGTDAVAGRSGENPRPGRGASATITFSCD